MDTEPTKQSDQIGLSLFMLLLVAAIVVSLLHIIRTTDFPIDLQDGTNQLILLLLLLSR
jgi:hypothetical protein